MREFNTFGPVNPQYHYHVNRVAVKAALREKVEKGRYMTLNAARQTGKTTLFRELIEELEATGAYFGILLDFEQLADFSGERFYERLSQMLNRWQQSEKPTAVVPPPMRDQGDFVDWLRATTLSVGQRVVLIIDEFDAIPMETVKALLSQFRAMYLERYDYTDVIHSILLVGMRNIPAAALQSVGGYVTIEALSSAGEMDILAFYRNQRFIVETKVWYGKARFEPGKAQVVAYLQASGLPKGWLIVFDEKLGENPLLTTGPAIFETTEADKVIRVYLVGIAV